MKMSLKSVLVAMVVLAAMLAEAAPRKTKAKQTDNGSSSLRQQATAELEAKESTTNTPIPSVMMPLPDDYVPSKGRYWDWAVEGRVGTHRMFGSRPTHGYGIANLEELGPQTFFGLAAGMEKHFWDSYWGLNVIGEATNRRSNFRAPTGLVLPMQIQYFSYGLEPRWSYIFNRWFGTTASVMVQTVTVNHSALDSVLATWTVQYLERTPRLAADFYLTQTASSKQRVSLAFENRISELGQQQAWSLAFGATW